MRSGLKQGKKTAGITNTILYYIMEVPFVELTICRTNCPIQCQ